MQSFSRYAYLTLIQNIETKRLAAFKEAGVNRVSMGVQTFNQSHLKWMNRSHTVDDSIKALKETYRLFKGRSSFDLIYGHPNQKLADWKADLEAAKEYFNGHISIYQLTVEAGTL